jgi:RecA/RadA recombinase
MPTYNNKLLEKLLGSKSGKAQSLVSETDFFTQNNYTRTDYPALNIAMSGDMEGGLTSGLTVLAGESRTFKSCMSLIFAAAYLKKYKDAVCLFYDTEFGMTKEYMEGFELDTSRVVHIPVEHVEQLKFDLVQKLEAINEGDKVFILIDSIGNAASKKELEDAIEEKSVADMSRAKAIKSLFRIITPKLLIKDIPCVAVAHVYKEIGLFPKTIVSGGTSIMYSANTVVVVTKSQNKSGTELEGFTFNLNIDKSRYVKEKSKIPLTVDFESGIDKHSGILELALLSGHIEKPSNGWYQLVGTTEKVREKNVGPLLDDVLQCDDFKEFVKSYYKLSSKNNITQESLEDDDGAADSE